MSEHAEGMIEIVPRQQNLGHYRALIAVKVHRTLQAYISEAICFGFKLCLRKSSPGIPVKFFLFVFHNSIAISRHDIIECRSSAATKKRQRVIARFTKSNQHDKDKPHYHTKSG